MQFLPSRWAERPGNTFVPAPLHRSRPQLVRPPATRSGNVAAIPSPPAVLPDALALSLGILVLLAATALISPAAAQQYVVDDAEIVDEGACHVEAWHGQEASWILPACQPIRNLELAVGAGFVDVGAGNRETEYAIEAKTLFRPLTPGDWGVGLVLGVGPNPSAEPGERRFGDVYAFVPASLSIADDRVILHGNLGWEWDRESTREDDQVVDRDDHHLTWGARADVELAPQLSLLTELFGVDGERPAYQLGFRLHPPGAGLEMDVSWGGHTADGGTGAGWTVGLALVSARIF